MKEVGTQAVIRLKVTMANTSGQNSCDINTCHPRLMPSVTAKASEGSVSSFPTLR